MLEIISDIIKAEEQAKQVVAGANERARERKAQVEDEERNALEAATADAEEKHRAAVAQARQTFESAYHEAVREQSQRGREFESAHADRIETAVERVVGLIATPAHKS